MKRHVLLVISCDPIDPGDIESQPGVNHFICQKVDVEYRHRIDEYDMPSMVVRNPVIGQGIKGTAVHGHGEGRSEGCAIVAWLYCIVRSFTYEPLRNRRTAVVRTAEK